MNAIFETALSRVFGTGDPGYDRAFGWAEKRLLRLAKVSDPLRLAYYRSVAFGLREFARLLFLYPSSPFHAALPRLKRETAGALASSWAALIFAALSVDPAHTPPPEAAPQELRRMLEKAFRVPVGPLGEKIADQAARLGDKALYEELLEALCAGTWTPVDLELSITFGLLLARALDSAGTRFGRLQPVKKAARP